MREGIYRHKFCSFKVLPQELPEAPRCSLEVGEDSLSEEGVGYDLKNVILVGDLPKTVPWH